MAVFGDCQFWRTEHELSCPASAKSPPQHHVGTGSPECTVRFVPLFASWCVASPSCIRATWQCSGTASFGALSMPGGARVPCPASAKSPPQHHVGTGSPECTVRFVPLFASWCVASPSCIRATWQCSGTASFGALSMPGGARLALPSQRQVPSATPCRQWFSRVHCSI